METLNHQKNKDEVKTCIGSLKEKINVPLVRDIFIILNKNIYKSDIKRELELFFPENNFSARLEEETLI